MEIILFYIHGFTRYGAINKTVMNADMFHLTFCVIIRFIVIRFLVHFIKRFSFKYDVNLDCEINVFYFQAQ